MSRKAHRRKREQIQPPRQAGARRQAERLHTLLVEAVGLREQGRLTDAAILFQKALKLDPRNPAALQHLALLKNDLGEPDKAIALLRRSLTHTPNDPVCQNNLGNVLRSQGRTEESLRAYEAALALDANYVNALFNIGITHAQADTTSPEQALGYLERAARLAPNDVQNWEALGKVFSSLKKPDKAVSAFERALAIDPSRADAHNGLGGVAVTEGKVAEARAHFQRALELQPGHPNSIEYLARSRKYTAQDAQEIQRISEMLSQVEDEETACTLHFALGKMYDDCALFEKAFPHYHAGNRIRHSQSKFDPEAVIDEVSAIIELFSKEFFEGRRGYGCQSELPVVIVGPPRSGTTLVEQIIASHGSAGGAGEVTFLHDQVTRCAEGSGSSFPGCVALLGKETLMSLANHYLRQLQAVAPTMDRITDKAISGGFYLGLLALMFPRSRVVYCQRDLLSVGLSIYFQRFAKGTLPFSYDMRSIGIYCNQYARLMRHWRKVLPLSIHAVSYEDMVENQEPMTRELIDFCDLPWDERCLSFFETKRSVHTASHWQVRQPIYKHSVDRAKSYRDFIGPLREGLAIEVD